MSLKVKSKWVIISYKVINSHIDENAISIACYTFQSRPAIEAHLIFSWLISIALRYTASIIYHNTHLYNRMKNNHFTAKKCRYPVPITLIDLLYFPASALKELC